MNKAGVKFGIIIIMTVMCLAGCSKEKAFVDSCDSEIAEQVTSIMQEFQKGRYNLENCEVFVTEESKKDGYVVRRMTFQADWKRVREPIDDPLIRGMLQARDELESPGEKEAAGKIINGYLVEMNSEPESERIETKFVAQISPGNETLELFYPFVQEGEETLVPFREYAEENWSENAKKRMQEGRRRLIDEVEAAGAGEDEESDGVFPIVTSEPVSILTTEEEQNLRDEAMSAAEQCGELYKEAEIVYPETEYSRIEGFSDQQRKEVVKRLGEQGLVSVSDDINMENYQKMQDFYSAYVSGRDAMVTVFSVYMDGNIGALTFIHRNGKIQSFYVSVGWGEGGVPEIKGFGSNDLEEIRLTEKGYFIYTNTETIAHGNLREYYRVKPLSDECRELTKKYIYGLSFVNYNMLVTNWDASNVEEILMPCMFEDIYPIYTKEPFKTEGGLIPAEIYERVMTTCFPVSVEQVREHCGYRADVDSYEYEMIFARQFPPFGEVVDYKQGEDGTITLYVDGVWIDYNSDYAFTNQIVVQPFPDGTFRYLSNTIEQKELELPRVEK